MTTSVLKPMVLALGIMFCAESAFSEDLLKTKEGDFLGFKGAKSFTTCNKTVIPIDAESVIVPAPQKCPPDGPGPVQLPKLIVAGTINKFDDKDNIVDVRPTTSLVGRVTAVDAAKGLFTITQGSHVFSFFVPPTDSTGKQVTVVLPKRPESEVLLLPSEWSVAGIPAQGKSALLGDEVTVTGLQFYVADSNRFKDLLKPGTSVNIETAIQGRTELIVKN